MKKLLTILICLAAGNHMFGQSLPSSSGNHHESGDIQLSYSIGEPVIATYSDAALVLTQGFHQASDYALSAAAEERLELQVYPNPCTDLLHIRLAEPGVHRLMLYDLHGRLLKQERQFMAAEQIIDMNGLPSGMYLLQLISEQGDMSSGLPVQKL